jgi:Icc-related predicted phosphoesterase
MKILAIGDFQAKFPAKLERKLRKENFDIIAGVGDYTGVDDWRPYIMYLFKANRNNEKIKSAEEFFGKKQMKILDKKDEKSMQMVLKKIESFGKPVIFIMGNGDDRWYNYPFSKGTLITYELKITKPHKQFLKSLRNFININYKKKKVRGINWIGFGGYMDISAYVKEKEFIRNKKVTERRIKRIKEQRKLMFNMLKGIDSKKTIFVLHYPPKGIFDIIKDRANPRNGTSVGIEFFADAIKDKKPLLVLCGHMHEYQGMKKLYGIPVVNPGDAGMGKAAIIDVDENKRKINNVKFIK